MLSAINSIRFTATNNHKNNYNNQKAVSSQQSFGAARPPKATATFLGLIMTVIAAVSPATVAKAEVKAAHTTSKVTAKAAKAVKKAKKTVDLCSLQAKSKLEKSLVLIPEELRAPVSELEEQIREGEEFLGGWGIKPEALDAFKIMQANAKKDGINLSLDGGYQRSYECVKGADGSVARNVDGRESGSTFSIAGVDEESDSFGWLYGKVLENVLGHASKYNFVLAHPNKSQGFRANVWTFKPDIKAE